MAQSRSYPNSGALFKNTRKTEDKHPDYTGPAEINGVKYQMAAWLKEGNGKKFLSVSFKKNDGDRRGVGDGDDIGF